jgi:ligand-binding SRPBCC domain-containing protein
MRLHSLQRVQIVPVELAAAWDFFCSTANLSLITPPDLKFVVTSPLQTAMYPGMLITYTVTPFWGVKVTWISEITHVAALSYFVDEQRMGPYRLWHHQHHFREVSTGVEVTDLVHYALPFDPLSRPLQPLVQRRLELIFSYRAEALRQRLG